LVDFQLHVRKEYENIQSSLEGLGEQDERQWESWAHNTEFNIEP